MRSPWTPESGDSSASCGSCFTTAMAEVGTWDKTGLGSVHVYSVKMYLLGRLCAGPLPLLWSVFIVRILELVEVPQVLRLLPERGLLFISQRLPDLAEILRGVKYSNEKNIYTSIIILAGIRRGCIASEDERNVFALI